MKISKYSILNHIYTIDIKGFPGEISLVIFHNKTPSLRIWFDRKDTRSVAKSTTSEASLMIGVNRCETDNLVKMIKLTTCQARDCTCNAIEKRCDQIVNCMDKYDEDNMKHN